MTWAVKFLVVAVLAAAAVAVFLVTRSSSSGTDNTVQPAGEKQIGASLQKALALLDAMPPVPALKPLLDAAQVPTQTAVVIPVLVTGIQPSAGTGASGEPDPGHMARDDIGGWGPPTRLALARRVSYKAPYNLPTPPEHHRHIP